MIVRPDVYTHMMVSFSVEIEVTHQCLGYTEVCHLSEIYVVDRCKDANHITVARKNPLRILSSGLKERCCMALLFQLCPGSDSEGTDIKGNESPFWFLVFVSSIL